MTPTPATCANPNCDRAVPRPKRPGRPAIYCSPGCRRTRRPPDPLIVEVQHPDISPDGRPAQRVWTVQLRRGDHTVIIANNLGWPTANALAHELNNLLLTNTPNNGAAID
jgi:hypothetical protein